MDSNEFGRRFTAHVPTEKQKVAMDDIRLRCEQLAHNINFHVDDCREKSLAITKLEEMMFWTNAGIARYQETRIE